ncbi:MAG: FtsW/RodA/SpoVE family cell cycle protein [Planctomycetes bacterium]|nr:FtsW/RodA/SpoVE family cell cycle protein [Planctomycetota bacterium]MBI3833743.1 FtsW/RodA/SpoVE family cell cycle protein [Planctomycetota bacterium]
MRRSPLQLTPVGWAIVAAAGVLSIIGIASIYVTDTHYIAGDDGPANAMRQVLRMITGLGLAFLILRVGHQSLARYAYAFFAVATILLVPLLVAKMLHTTMGGLVRPRNGAYRWIQFPGVLLQPSELIKLAMVIALACYLRFRANYRRLSGLIVPLLAASAPILLVLLEPDLGTALLLIPVVFVMLYVAGAKARHLIVLALLGLGLAPLAWPHIEPYQRLRITTVLLQSDPLRHDVVREPDRFTWLATKRQALEWKAGAGYQLVHSKNALGSGGSWGNGWGQGTYVENPQLLPDRHNDFVFAMVGHQWGFAGCVLVISCYLIIVIAGVRIASQTLESFSRLVAVGVVTLIACQALINMGMSTGLLPVTGMTLPFVSYGGSSVLCNFAAIAVLISVAQHRPYLLTRDPLIFRREQTELLPAVRSEAGAQRAPSPVVAR